MSSKSTKKMRLALVLLEQRRRHFAEWEESCREERKQGYRPSACVHGVSQWTDYDSICGPCEDGLGWWDYLAQARDCLDEALVVEQKVRQRRNLCTDMAVLDDRHRVGSHDVLPWRELADWADLPYSLKGIN